MKTLKIGESYRRKYNFFCYLLIKLAMYPRTMNMVPNFSLGSI